MRRFRVTGDRLYQAAQWFFERVRSYVKGCGEPINRVVDTSIKLLYPGPACQIRDTPSEPQIDRSQCWSSRVRERLDG